MIGPVTCGLGLLAFLVAWAVHRDELAFDLAFAQVLVWAASVGAMLAGDTFFAGRYPTLHVILSPSIDFILLFFAITAMSSPPFWLRIFIALVGVQLLLHGALFLVEYQSSTIPRYKFGLNVTFIAQEACLYLLYLSRRKT